MKISCLDILTKYRVSQKKRKCYFFMHNFWKCVECELKGWAIYIHIYLYIYIYIGLGYWWNTNYEIPCQKKNLTSAVLETTVSRHNGGKLRIPLKPPNTIVLRRFEGFQGGPQLGLYDAESLFSDTSDRCFFFSGQVVFITVIKHEGSL